MYVYIYKYKFIYIYIFTQGKLVTFDCGKFDGVATTDKLTGSARVTVSQVVEDNDLVMMSNSFHAALATGIYVCIYTYKYIYIYIYIYIYEYIYVCIK
jgi:hypothetical protein